MRRALLAPVVALALAAVAVPAAATPIPGGAFDFKLDFGAKVTSRTWTQDPGFTRINAKIDDCPQAPNDFFNIELFQRTGAAPTSKGQRRFACTGDTHEWVDQPGGDYFFVVTKPRPGVDTWTGYGTVSYS